MKRRQTVSVRVGNTVIGSDHPVKVQSMTNTSTLDTAGSIGQILRIARAGGDIVRLTAQGVREAANLAEISHGLRRQGCDVPLVADIHFNPKAAFEAAQHVEKVRINPGNFVDPGRTFAKLEFSEEEYSRELKRIEQAFTPFLELCSRRGVAIRLGVNHGSLSDRIMSRYGDTPAGMVESAMEFLRVAVRCNFDQIVISIKASNVVVMTTTVRLLVEAMEREDMHFPIHLGVTEAGDGEDARVKSAVGIGSLLVDGIGDTIRVSLSEDPENEIPVGRMLVDYIANRKPTMAMPSRRSVAVPLVAAPAGCSADDFDPDRQPDVIGPDGSESGMIRVKYSGVSPDEVVIRASVDLGSLLLAGYGDCVMIEADTLSPRECVNLCFSILQACRLRITRTEYIACPSCGRTLFDLQSALHRVKEATAGLRGLKIAVMGCIVNGPGEMADADYGYIGAGVGRVSLYRGKECVVKNIPADDALPALINLLKADGVM